VLAAAFVIIVTGVVSVLISFIFFSSYFKPFPIFRAAFILTYALLFNDTDTADGEGY